MEFELVIGFIEHLQIVLTNKDHALTEHTIKFCQLLVSSLVFG
jgi:hypothetical protein